MAKRDEDQRRLFKEKLVPSDPGSEELFKTEYDAENGEPVECLGMTFESDEKRREYFLEKLREKLKDPEFRKIEGFPIGEDEDILALSDPPYYTACPNPWIGDFIKCYGKPYDPDEPYNRAPFAVDVSEGKNDPIYNAHAYHTKVSYLAIAHYLEHFTDPQDLVLDVFCGTGMTGVAASQMAGGERYCVECELSTAASFISNGFRLVPSLHSARSQACRIVKALQTQYGWMYETNHCGWDASERDPRKRVNNPTSDLIGKVNFVVWSDVFICSECGGEVVFWESAVSFEECCVLDTFRCAQCNAVLHKKRLQKAMHTVFDAALSKPIIVTKRKPVLINYTYDRKRYEKEPDCHDREVTKTIDEMEISEWYPIDRMPEGDESRRNDDAGITHIHHFYTKRNLHVLSKARKIVREDPRLLFWFTATLPWCGRENRLHIGNYFGRKGGQITSLRGTWYVPSLSVETNAIERLRLRIDSSLVDTGIKSRSTIISTQSATQLPQLLSKSADYIFIDPPFGDNLMYSELNCIWESWLKVTTNTRPEAIINRTQEKGLMDYKRLMEHAFSECNRILKPGRWITVEFHNSKNAVWNAIQEALQIAGFVVADVRILDKGKGSFKQVTSSGSVKQDLVISAYRPGDDLEQRFKLEAGTEDGAWDFVRTHLRQLPVFVSNSGQVEMVAERQNYLLFDRMVAFHVQRGVTVPLSAADFYAGLAQRFPERDGMYFLPEQVAEYDKKRMTVREILQLELFVMDEATAIQWLKQQLSKKPQTFQELHPRFLKEIGGWQKYEKPLELSELLEKSFLRYKGTGDVPSQIHSYLSTNFKELRNLSKDDPALQDKAKDRWYVPDPNQAKQLEELRERSLMKEFWEYLPAGYKAAKPESQEGFIPGLESKPAPIPRAKRIKVIRLEAVRAGFKHCWENRDYRTIIAVAQRIPSNVLEEDPKLTMWYTNALTRMGEDA